MKQRIKINSGERFEILIPAYYDVNKQKLLILWMILWSLAGLGIVSQFFAPTTDGLGVYLVVWMAFWAYFEYKIIYAYRWRRFGVEIISISDESLVISREIAGRAIPTKFELDFIKNIRTRESNPNTFFTAMNRSYWSPGDEKIQFDYKGREGYFGMEINETDVKLIIKALNKQLKSL